MDSQKEKYIRIDEVERFCDWLVDHGTDDFLQYQYQRIKKLETDYDKAHNEKGNQANKKSAQNKP